MPIILLIVLNHCKMPSFSLMFAKPTPAHAVSPAVPMLLYRKVVNKDHSGVHGHSLFPIPNLLYPAPPINQTKQVAHAAHMIRGEDWGLSKVHHSFLSTDNPGGLKGKRDWKSSASVCHRLIHWSFGLWIKWWFCLRISRGALSICFCTEFLETPVMLVLLPHTGPPHLPLCVLKFESHMLYAVS